MTFARLAFPLALLAGLAAPAAAAPDWSRGTPVRVTVTNDRFVPDAIALRRNRPYVLTLRNPSTRTHNFSAPSFFKYARVSPRDAGWVTDNAVTLRPGQTARLHIVAPDTPNARYDFRSTRLGDAAERLKGIITVR